MTSSDTDIDPSDSGGPPGEPGAADRDEPAGGSDDGYGPIARVVGSDETMVWLKRVILGVALAFLIGSFGYFIGVRTSQAPGNDVDAGFLRDMTDHHDQAVQMAQAELANGSDPVVKGFAMEVILFQRQELGRIQNFQDELGVARPEYDPERSTMEWMGMATPLRAMPGMATEAQLAQLDAAKGTEADKLFLTLMQAHHVGGAHMADYEAANGANPAIKEMAATIARNQRIEVNEYQGVLDRLNAK